MLLRDGDSSRAKLGRVQHRQAAANDLDRRLTLSSSVFICVFSVFCGSITFLTAAKTVPTRKRQQKAAVRPIGFNAKGAVRDHGLPFKGPRDPDRDRRAIGVWIRATQSRANRTKHAEENHAVGVQPIGRRRTDLAGDDRTIERGHRRRRDDDL
jgi:hypothetical protein